MQEEEATPLRPAGADGTTGGNTDEVARMRTARLADTSSPEIQARFRRAQALLAECARWAPTTKNTAGCWRN